MDNGTIGQLYLDIGIDYAALAQQLGVSESMVAASAEKMANAYIKAQEKAKLAGLNVITGDGLNNFLKQAEADGFKATEAIKYLQGEVNRLSAARQAASRIEQDSFLREKEMMDRHMGDLQAAARAESEMMKARNKDALRPEQGPLYNEKAANATRLSEEAAYQAKREAIERDAALRRREIQAQELGDELAAQRAADEARLAEAALINKRIQDALRPELGPLNRVAPIASPGAELIKFGTAANAVGANIAALGQATTFALTLPIAAGVAGMLHYSGIIEKAQASLGRLLGSQNLAEKMIADLRQFSLTTPFKFEGSLEAFRKLTEMGFAAKEAIPLMRTLGDQVAAVGGNTKNLNDLVSVFGKINQQGYVSAIEMRAFRAAAIPAFDFLKEGLNQSGSELSANMKKHLIVATEAIPIILAGMRKRSEGEMETMSKTMLGMWENVKEKVTFALADIGTAFIPLAKRTEEWAFNALDGATNAAKAFAAMNPAAQNATLGIVAMLAALGPVEYIIGKIIKGFGGAATAVGYLQKIIATSTATSVLTGLAGAIEVIATGAVAAGAAMTTWKLLEAVGDLGRLAAAVLNVSHQQDGWVAIMNTALEKLGALSKVVLPDIVQRYFLQFGGRNKEADADIERMRNTPFGGNGHMIADLTERVRGGAGAKEATEALFGKFGVTADKMLRPEVINGKLTTGALADANSTANKLRRDTLNEEEDDGHKAKKDNTISKAFSELGLKDVKKDLVDIYAAFKLIEGKLTGTQTGEAIKKIEDTLFLARKHGVLDDTTKDANGKTAFDRAFDANRARLVTPEAKLAFNGGSYQFQPPASAHLTMENYAEDIAKYTKEQAKITEARKEWDTVVKKNNILLHEKSMLETGGSSSNMEAQAWQAEEEAVATVNGLLNKQIAVLESNSLAWTENKTLQETWTEGVRKALKPIEDADKALAAFGIKNHSAELSRMEANWKALTTAQQRGIVSILDVKRAWVAMAEEHLALGEKLTAADEKQYYQYKRQIDQVNILKQSWTGFKNQISTIMTDFGRGVMDIFLPKTPAAKDLNLGVPSRIIDDFKSAFNSLSAQGFTDPKKALEEVIAKIKEAGSTAEANTIAVRNFGQSGPEIARLLRTGALSAAQLARTFDVATDSMGKLENTSTKNLSKVTQLWREVERSIGRALIETGAKAIATFVGIHMKTLLHSLEELLTKLPVIGGALAKVFGIGGAVGGKLPNIPGGSNPLGGSIPIGLPGQAPLPAPPVGSVGGAAGSAGSAGSAATGFGSSIATNIIGLAGVGVSAAAGIVAGVQGHHANALLDKIEKSTREISTVTWQTGAESIQGLLKGIYLTNVTLNDRAVEIRAALFDPVAQDLEHLMDAVKGGGGGLASGGSVNVAGATIGTVGDTYNIYIDSSLADVGSTDDAVEVIQAASRLLKAQGVTSRHRYSPGV